MATLSDAFNEYHPPNIEYLSRGPDNLILWGVQGCQVNKPFDFNSLASTAGSKHCERTYTQVKTGAIDRNFGTGGSRLDASVLD